MCQRPFTWLYYFSFAHNLCSFVIMLRTMTIRKARQQHGSLVLCLRKLCALYAHACVCVHTSVRVCGRVFWCAYNPGPKQYTHTLTHKHTQTRNSDPEMRYRAVRNARLQSHQHHHCHHHHHHDQHDHPFARTPPKICGRLSATAFVCACFGVMNMLCCAGTSDRNAGNGGNGSIA